MTHGQNGEIAELLVQAMEEMVRIARENAASTQRIANLMGIAALIAQENRGSS